MPERKLKITPINPFTPRQAEIVEILANGATNKEAASKLGISYQTVKNHVANDTCGAGSIFRRIEEITGNRPGRNNWIAPLIGDVLIFVDEEEK